VPDPEADVQVIEQFETALRNIGSPISDEEAIALARLFSEDDCYGLAWTLLHLIETAPPLAY
jgi:hypothetical protein